MVVRPIFPLVHALRPPNAGRRALGAGRSTHARSRSTATLADYRRASSGRVPRERLGNASGGVGNRCLRFDDPVAPTNPQRAPPRVQPMIPRRDQPGDDGSVPSPRRGGKALF